MTYKDFYINQAGSGIDIYSGYRHSDLKGNGFFGRLIGSAVLPILKKIGPLAAKGARSLLDIVDPPVEEKEKKGKRSKKKKRKGEEYF